MSVYRDTNTTVVFEHPHPGPLTADIYHDNVLVLGHDDIGLITPSAGRYTLPLTYEETQFDGELRIVWTGSGTFERTQTVEVVTPIVSLSRITPLFADENKTPAELAELETVVRKTIEAYTGQSFGHSVGTRVYYGSGGKRILMGEHLHRLVSFAGGWKSSIRVSSDGWALDVIPEHELRIKEAPPEEFLTYVTHGVIRVPEYYIKAFNAGAQYVVAGEWGYPSVPEEVQEAALLLCNDYACGDTAYRDRFLESVKIGSDTFIYGAGAYRGTGNARADLLLKKFRRMGMVII